MGLCQQCIHFSTRDSDEYLTYCARCRDRNKFVRRNDEAQNGASPLDALRARQDGGYKPYVQPKQQAGQPMPAPQNMQNVEAMQGAVNMQAQAGIANVQTGMPNIPGMQMPWQNMFQGGAPGYNQTVGQGINPAYNAVKPAGAHVLGTSPESKTEELSLRDKFALVALQNPSLNISYSSPSDIATICYAIADALLEKRDR